MKIVSEVTERAKEHVMFVIRENEKESDNPAINVPQLCVLIGEIEPISEHTIRKAVEALYKDGKIECITGKGRSKYWRSCGSAAGTPKSPCDEVYDIIRRINDEEKRPATVNDILKETGLTNKDVARGKIKYLSSGLKTVRIISMNKNEWGCIVNEHRFDYLGGGKSTGKKSEPKELVIKPFTGITKNDIRNAYCKTNIGDKMIVNDEEWVYNHKGRVGKKRLVPGERTVENKTKRLCIFNDGSAFPWSDIANFIKNGKPIVDPIRR